MMRTHDAGTLRAADAGSTVTLTGWVARRRDHGGVAFLDLRDASGLVQVVVRDEMLAASDAHDLRNEYCILVTGSVELRPEGNANLELPTGEVEVVVDPTDWERDGMERGTPFALAHRFFQTGPFRPANVDARAPGLVFAGSGTVPGVGVPMVLLSGRLAAERVEARR